MVRLVSDNMAANRSIQNLDMLRQSLVSNGIEISEWGTGDAKTVESLWTELELGEIQLQGDPLCRVLSGVVQVIIRHPDGRILIEEEQILQDGRRRHRNIPPSEKMLGGETYIEAARRCLVEELGANPRTADVLTFTHRVRQERRNSWSYPGLTSLYTIHQVQVRVPDIPQDNFHTAEIMSDTEGLVREHYWVWKTPPEGLLFR